MDQIFWTSIVISKNKHQTWIDFIVCCPQIMVKILPSIFIKFKDKFDIFNTSIYCFKKEAPMKILKLFKLSLIFSML